MALDPGSQSQLLVAGSHLRSKSGESHTYSLLDFYDGDTFDIESFEAASALLDSAVADPLVGSVDDKFGLLPAPKAARQSAALASLEESWAYPRLAPVDAPLLPQRLDDDYDLYGFRKESTFFESTKESHNTWFQAYAPHMESQKRKWEMLMRNNGLGLHEAIPTRFPPKSDKVKKLVRKGIPPEWRGLAWFFYAGGYERLNKHVGVYEKIVVDTAGVVNKDTEVIERDLHRTFPDNRFFNRDERDEQEDSEVIRALRRVLVAFAHYQPQIGYCQSLNFLAGLLLLFMSEERAFWMLVIMTERIIPKVHTATLEGVHTDQGVLMMCIREYIPKLWTIIGKSYDGSVLSEDKILTRLPPLTLVTLSWFMSVFVGVLPTETVLRIWDILWYEGSKTIFRISLTVCRLCLEHPSFMSARGTEGGEAEQIELFQFIQNFPKSITDPNLLIDLCFKKIGGYGFGFLAQDEINGCRQFVSQQRSKLLNKKRGIGAEMSEQEREALRVDDEIHDVYGFNKSIMSGVTWNKHISSRMKKFGKKK